MRRKDREVQSIPEILEIIGDCTVCHVAMFDEEYPYVVPLSFGFKFEENVLTLYFHSAFEGRKIDCLKQNPKVCFEISKAEKIEIDRNNFCKSGCFYESVIGRGEAKFIEDIQEKRDALKLLMRRQSGGESFTFTEEQASRVHAFKIIAKEFSAKRR